MKKKLKLPFRVQPGIIQSMPEIRIARILKGMGLDFYQEVMFERCINPKTKATLRFDFYIPSKNLLIEFDGIDFHSDDSVLARDAVKDSFAKQSSIRLIRLIGVKCLKNTVTRLVSEIPDSTRNVYRWPSNKDKFAVSIAPALKSTINYYGYPVPHLPKEDLQFISSSFERFKKLSMKDRELILRREHLTEAMWKEQEKKRRLKREKLTPKH